MLKKCCRCKKYLDKSMFTKNKLQPDGLQYYCKDCHKESEKNRIAKKLDNITKHKKYENMCDGYSIYILNYAKQGEFKYTLTGNNINISTNDINEFKNKVNYLLKQLKE